ncbi:hypothetical protein E8E95_06735 [Pseudomonas sp. BN414]|uniref:saccharopine dehydrogenase NADP-binding domain-containing protein n=1 Tax=Pseudomonas sp. BN414 TaxID=2567888 RepID=UPI0024587506|nr:saccharopine dehydrogenase NADP-binding domain-containing protein [Pseudomonas sp. BN414]MDH4566367.1 hypothetical protein [Pseudomonas sp. BN414]
MKLPCPFDGRLVMIGFGCIGRGVLPLLLRHIDMQPGQLLVISPDEEDGAVAAGFQVPFKVLRLTEENHRAELDTLLGAGDFLLNRSVQVESAALIALGHTRGAYWYGSRLTIEQARALCQHNSATSLQVSATVMAGVIWTLANPDRGILEPDQLPHDEILELCRPYLGELAGYYSDWTPLQDRERLFPEGLDVNDPWQFVNVRYR